MSVIDVILQVATSAYTILYYTKVTFGIDQSDCRMPSLSKKGALCSNSSAVDSSTLSRL